MLFLVVTENPTEVKFLNWKGTLVTPSSSCNGPQPVPHS